MLSTVSIQSSVPLVKVNLNSMSAKGVHGMEEREREKQIYFFNSIRTL